MTVSVIIPTVLRSGAVHRSLRAAAESAARSHPDAEVLLVVNGAGPASPPRTDAANVRIIRSDATGVSAARNDGVAAARHDTVLFTDDDLVVPPDWCATMAAPLRGGAPVYAVAAPVRMVVTGPVTAYLDHERAFDAPPNTGDTARALVTANAGYRRDLMPGAPFDAVRYPSFAEDTDLGLRVRGAGGTIRWLADAPAPMHEVDEELASLARRALRQGFGTAQTYLRRRMLDYYLPAPVDAYRSLTRGTATVGRRYSEVDSPAAGTVFAALSLIRRGAMLAGYLDGLGSELGVPLIDIDEPALIAGLTGIFTELIDIVTPALDHAWQDVPVRFGPPDHGTVAPAGTLAGLSDVLCRTASLIDGVVLPAEAVGDDLAWLGWDAATRVRLVPIRRRLGAEPSERDLERAARGVGIPFGRACAIWEAQADASTRGWPGAIASITTQPTRATTLAVT